VRALRRRDRDFDSTGMAANIGSRIVEFGEGTLVLEASLTEEAHGFPSARGVIVHGGALATVADEALATVAFTLAGEGQATVTADLKVDFLRPARPGRVLARARVVHRTRRLAFCEASVQNAGGEVVAEARAVIAYVST
jgi:uncharacterized protein (TIGR00369 family)